MGAKPISGRQMLATLYWWLALAVGFLLSAVLVSAAVATNFVAVDATSPWTLWAVILIANPLVALAIRHIYRTHFDRIRNLTFLASAVLFVAVLHSALMLYLNE